MRHVYKAKIAAMIPATPANEVPTCRPLAAPVALAAAEPETVLELPVADAPLDPLTVPVAAEPVAEAGEPELRPV